MRPSRRIRCSPYFRTSRGFCKPLRRGVMPASTTLTTRDQPVRGGRRPHEEACDASRECRGEFLKLCDPLLSTSCTENTILPYYTQPWLKARALGRTRLAKCDPLAKNASSHHRMVPCRRRADCPRGCEIWLAHKRGLFLPYGRNSGCSGAPAKPRLRLVRGRGRCGDFDRSFWGSRSVESPAVAGRIPRGLGT